MQDLAQQSHGSDAAIMSGEPVWEVCFTPAGDRYYYNSVSGESVWTLPDGVDAVPRSTAQSSESGASAGNAQPIAASAWTLTSTDGEHAYYYNSATGESRWAQAEDWERHGVV